MDIKLIFPYTHQANTQSAKEGSIAKIRRGTKGNN